MRSPDVSIRHISPRAWAFSLLALSTSLLAVGVPVVASDGSSENEVVPTIALGSVRATEGAFAVEGIEAGSLFDQGLDARCETRLGPDELNGRSLAGVAGGRIALELGLVGCRTAEEPTITCEWRIYDDPAPDCQGAPPSTGPIFTDDTPLLRGAGKSLGWVGQLTVELPAEVGRFALELSCGPPEVEGARSLDPGDFQWTLYTTLAEPLAWVAPPPADWYERATCWARELAADSDEETALEQLLEGLYRQGAAIWRYGYAEEVAEHDYRFLVVDDGQGSRSLEIALEPESDEVRCFSNMCRCSWRQLVARPAVCNFGDCYIFSRVFQGIAAVLGIGGLQPIEIYGKASLGFVTPPSARSFDPDFPTSIRCAKEVEPCYPYFFGNHSLRRRDARLYDATFDRTYPFDKGAITRSPAAKGQDIAAERYDGPIGLNVASLGQEDLFFESEVRMRYSHGGYGQWSFYELLMPSAELPPPPTEGGVHFTGRVDFEPLYPTAGGYYENLEAAVEVLVLDPDIYYFKGVLTKGDEIIAHRPDIHTTAITDSVLHAEGGLHTIRLTFSGEEIYRSGKNGPWELRVTVQSPSEIVEINPFKVHAFPASVYTPDYQYGQFGQQPAHMTGHPTVSPGFEPGGRRLAWLEIATEIFVREKGRYAVEGRLAVEGRTLLYAGESRELDTGSQVLTMRFERSELRRSQSVGVLEATVNLFGSRQIVLDSWQAPVGGFEGGAFTPAGGAGGQMP